MNLKLKKINGFQGRQGPLLLVILDGIGLAPEGPANSVFLAKTPCLDRLLREAPICLQLKAHGTAVGLPSDKDMGNSEIGHNALGAGRVFDQGSKLVQRAIQSETLFQTNLWKKLVEAGRSGNTLHFIGLLSDGNVHSHVDHLFALLSHAAQQGASKIALHPLLDGRDVDPKSALIYIEQTESVLEKLRKEHKVDAKIASGGGRMLVTMDRYNADWKIVERGWKAHVHGEARPFASAKEAITTLYEEDSNVNDQTLPAFVIVDESGKPVAPIMDGDGVVFFNFRGDRAIEISRAFEEDDFSEFDRARRPHVTYAGMMEYDGDLKVPKQFLVPPPEIHNTLSEYLCSEGVASFALSETQKYGHVTYFWNGNRSGYVHEDLEQYIEIPSDQIPFNQAPRMKADEIADKTIELLRTGKFPWGRINFANGDMVGHTGDLNATIQAVEAVDENLKRLIDCVDALQGTVVVLADHGNAEAMFEIKKGVQVVKTSHTLNPVPFLIWDKAFPGKFEPAEVNEPGLAHVAATLLNLLGYEKPIDYEPSLIKYVGK